MRHFPVPRPFGWFDQDVPSVCLCWTITKCARKRGIKRTKKVKKTKTMKTRTRMSPVSVCAGGEQSVHGNRECLHCVIRTGDTGPVCLYVLPGLLPLLRHSFLGMHLWCNTSTQKLCLIDICLVKLDSNQVHS